MTYRLAIVVSHPIQHFAAFYRGLAAHPKIDLTVLFASSIGAKPYFDKDMNTEIKWSTDLLGGYDHKFLDEADSITRASPMTLNNPSVGRELSRLRPEAVLLYGYNHLTNVRALAWCRRNDVPVMMIADSELKGRRPAWVRFAKQSMLPVLFRQFTCFLTVGDCNEEHYLRYGIPRERLFRSPFTIDETTYRTARRQRATLGAELRGARGIPDDHMLCLTVGKVNERKRTRDVIEAARRIKSERGGARRVRFMIAGDGADLRPLEAVARAESLPVDFLGFVNVDALPRVYAAADAIVHPSAQDPHPLVMSEAACVGLPLVVSDRVGAIGPTDIARKGENTLVFPCGDVEALVHAVKRLAVDTCLRTTMGRRSTAIFEELDLDRSISGAVAALEYCVSAKLPRVKRAAA